MIDVQKLVLSVIALAVAVAGYLIWRHEERAIGAAAAQVAVLTSRSDSQAVRIAADSLALLRKDTALVYRNVVRSDTVLQRLIDSAIVLKHDTVWVTREVLVEAKAALDSTKGVAQACCSLAADRAKRIGVLDSLNKDLAERIPSAGKPWIDRGLGFLACGAVAYVARR